MSLLAVLIAGAAGMMALWLFWRAKMPLWAYAIQLIPAAMLGHAFARIGADTLAAKPWLYFMQSGGLAVAFVLPALCLLGLRDGRNKTGLFRDSAAFILAYLAMGAVFYFLG